MSCSRCGGVLAVELIDAMRSLVCGMDLIEGRYCRCDDVKGPSRTNMPHEKSGALGKELPETSTSKGRTA